MSAWTERILNEFTAELASLMCLPHSLDRAYAACKMLLKHTLKPLPNRPKRSAQSEPSTVLNETP